MSRPIDLDKLNRMHPHDFYKAGVGNKAPPPPPRTVCDDIDDENKSFYQGAGAWSGPNRSTPAPELPFGLPWNATFEEVKAKYRKLLKLYHPDTNGGDRSYESALTEVKKAFEDYKKTK